MTAAASSGLQVRLLVQLPVCELYTSRLGLVPGEVGLDPGDLHDFVKLRQNPAPQITMLNNRRRSPLEGGL